MIHKLTCPHCDGIVNVYHLDWSAIVCLHCRAEVGFDDWGRDDA